MCRILIALACLLLGGIAHAQYGDQQGNPGAIDMPDVIKKPKPKGDQPPKPQDHAKPRERTPEPESGKESPEQGARPNR